MVDYLVARDGLPSRSGQAYDYVLAGDGLYLSTANEWLELRVPVARCSVRGLQPIYAACTLRQGRLPMTIWDEILHCLRLAHTAGTEVLTGVRHEGEAYHLVVPHQIVAPLAVHYAPQDDLLLELHSHRDGAAQFSAIDTADEQRLRIYGVVGQLDLVRPAVALRAGAYGYFLPVSWTSVFDGDCTCVDDVLAPDPSPILDELAFGWQELEL